MLDDSPYYFDSIRYYCDVTILFQNIIIYVY